jgi:hypothetical protein
LRKFALILLRQNPRYSKRSTLHSFAKPIAPCLSDADLAQELWGDALGRLAPLTGMSHDVLSPKKTIDFLRQ